MENNVLKEKLLKEREEFLSELNRENSLKQEMLNKLEAKMKEQEEVRLKEKQEFESLLLKETEQLRLAKQKVFIVCLTHANIFRFKPIFGYEWLFMTEWVIYLSNNISTM